MTAIPLEPTYSTQGILPAGWVRELRKPVKVNDAFAESGADQDDLHPNRQQRRHLVRTVVKDRQQRRNIHGFGRWRRPLGVSTYRYAFPFATGLYG